ncbi:hypothetical protein [Nitrososphaera sp. AFS]|uniref:hypothetical protein n=1 Tax=Nitrososphaera sp. AFS TaxID=2301191 RepID=UPI0013923730|nr:hypothetical protein [Nitrososphaera sp. AFS]
MSEKLSEIKRVYSGLETLYSTYFPKSDPSLIDDLLRRSLKNPQIPPIYMLEYSHAQASTLRWLNNSFSRRPA